MYACCADESREDPQPATCCCCFCVPQSSVGIVTNCGKYEGLAGPGIHFTDPCCVKVNGAMSLKLKSIEMSVPSKTKENVFVSLSVEVQYQVLPGAVDVAYYYLDRPTQCISSYVFANIRASVPLFTLDELYIERRNIAQQIKANVDHKMDEFGYDIVTVLIIDIQPDRGVRNIMDNLLAAKRLQVAAHDAAAAESILRIRRAEAKAELTRLSAVGVANQRREVLKGLEFCIASMAEALPNYSQDELLHILLTNQYLDTLREVSAQSGRTRGGGRATGGDGSDAGSLNAFTFAGQTAIESQLRSLEMAYDARHDAYEKRNAECQAALDVSFDDYDNNGYGSPRHEVTDEDLEFLRTEYKELLKMEKQIAKLKAEVKKEKDAAHTFDSSNANEPSSPKANPTAQNKGDGAKSPRKPMQMSSPITKRMQKANGGAGTEDVLYMPHVTSLKMLSRQLFRTATSGIPQDKAERERKAIAMMTAAPKTLKSALPMQ